MIVLTGLEIFMGREAVRVGGGERGEGGERGRG